MSLSLQSYCNYLSLYSSPSCLRGLYAMTLIIAAITHKDPNFIMETQLLDDSPFLYEWKTAEQDLEFLDYAYCFEGKLPPYFSYSNLLSLSDNDGLPRHEIRRGIHIHIYIYVVTKYYLSLSISKCRILYVEYLFTRKWFIMFVWCSF